MSTISKKSTKSDVTVEKKIEEVVEPQEDAQEEEDDAQEEEDDAQVEEDDADDADDVEDDEEDDGRIPIDLSENEVYRGICTLFEDEEGNNILEYISLLHTELIGINKSLEYLKGIKKELSRVADCAELMTKYSVDDETRKAKKIERPKSK